MNQLRHFETDQREVIGITSTHQWEITIDDRGQVVYATPTRSTLPIDSFEFRRWTKVWSDACYVMGSIDAAWQWLTTPTKCVDGRRPIDIMNTSYGCETLVSLLFAIDLGLDGRT